jgi:hypothetical protein
MNRSIINNQIQLIGHRISSNLNELANGDYSIEDIISIHSALSRIELELDALVVVDRTPAPMNKFYMLATATPTIIRDNPLFKPVPKNSPLDTPHETNLKRQF